MKPRILKPSKGNPYYINTADGGVNPAKGNPKRLNKDLTALPNCVAIYGWFNEVGQKGMQYLKKAYYPYAVIAQAKREGLEVTKEPTLGGIMVWTGGKTSEGHVAGVAQIFDDKHILTAESEYYGADWKNFKRYKGNGNWADGCPWMTSLYHYQGCIKNPFVKEEEDMTKKETEELIREIVPGMIETIVPQIVNKAYIENTLEQIKREVAKLPIDDWAKEAVNMCIAKGYMTGYNDGFHPQSYIRREEVAQVVANVTAKE